MMAFDNRSLESYVDVAERIVEFREKYPEGSLQPLDLAKPWELAVVNGTDKNGKQFAATMIVYVAAAYRSPLDQKPGIGMAWEVFPGRTPYTAGSELQNAETSAWGRAIVAALAADTKRGIASRQEIQNRQAERDDGLPVNRDGSLSRARTSDAEKDAAGVMTDAQHAEHTQLQKGTSRGRVPGTKRGPVPANEDMWSVPAAKGDTPAAVIFMHFKRLQIPSRDDRLRYTAALTGHAVPTTSALTKDEQEKLAGLLATFKNREALEAKAKQLDTAAKQDAST